MNAALRTSAVRGRHVATALGVSPSAVCQWTNGAAAPSEAAVEGIASLCGIAAADSGPEGALTFSKNARNALTRWLDELGLSGKDTHQKLVPRAVFRLPRQPGAFP